MPATRLSTSQYTADGSTATFPITFPFIDRDDISVLVDGESVDFNFTDDSEIELEETPSSGAEVEIFRTTQRGSRLVDFSGGSFPNPFKLNKAFTQIFYITQELLDLARGVLGRTVDNDYSAEGYRIRHVADPEAADDAVNRGWVDGLEEEAEAFRDEAQGFAQDANDSRQQAQAHANTAGSHLSDTRDARDEAFDARDVTQDLKDSVVSMEQSVSASESASQTAASEAQGYAQDAEEAATGIGDVRTAAEGFASDAENHAASALVDAESAEDAAEKAEGHEDSARGYATTAEGFAESAESFAENGLGGTSGFDLGLVSSDTTLFPTDWGTINNE